MQAAGSASVERLYASGVVRLLGNLNSDDSAFERDERASVVELVAAP